MGRDERKILEVRTDSGELLCRFRITIKDEHIPEPQKEEKQPEQKRGGNGNGNGAKPGLTDGGTYPPMTDAQKRYLFRLLVGEGIEGEAAHEELKKAFGVDTLKKVTKQEASQEIEKRLAAQKGGAVNGHA